METTPTEAKISFAKQNNCTELDPAFAKANDWSAKKHLCKCITDKTKRTTLNTELLKTAYTSTEVKAFFKDVLKDTLNTKALGNCNNLKSLKPEHIEAWMFIINAINTKGDTTAFAQDFPLINKVMEINNDQTLQAFFTQCNNVQNLTQFLYAYNDVYCNTCPPPSGRPEWLPKMHEILDNMVYAYHNLATTQRFMNFYCNEAFQTAINSRDGGQHMLKVIKNLGLDGTKVEGIDAYFNGTDGQRYDILLKAGAYEEVRFIECKSYKDSTDLTGSGVDQLIAYLSNFRVTSLNNLLYIFNAQKISDQQAKEKMQAVFKANSYAIWTRINAFPCIRNILNSNGQPINRQDFINMVDSLDNKLFGFVTTK